MPLREILTRRNLPHWFVSCAWHFVTYRVAGTIPVPVLHQFRQFREQRWREAKEGGKATEKLRQQLHKQFFASYDQFLDRDSKMDWLARPKLGALFRNNLYHHRGTKYDLLAYCVMPSHVHVLLRSLDEPADESSLVQSPQARLLAATSDGVFPDDTPDNKGPLARIMHSLKSYTANGANKLLGRTGQFWQHESFDHWVRDDEELERIVKYIAWNPVKAELVAKPIEWSFGSAHDRFLQDGSEDGYLLLPES